ncbi:ABC transporter permease subunit [Leuconostoc gelidum subsp. aenigmaticum]|uniref:ABC transporter permease n=1 Tax=Leuconostoc gelidum TaxID=1244 RepID=UPI001CC3C144|nr:ABC transporter permease subunit [Leuconostoc gelidum]MBZ6003809.1 ABC transporter permease subunit [Leuconostoc gelidum subsp. aenigmaticum]
MLTLMKQEYYKTFKQNRLYIWLGLSVIFPLAIMGIFKSQRGAGTITDLGHATFYVYLVGIIITALSVSQEFSFGTIRPLLSRRFSRGMIFTSKLILNFSIYITLFVGAFIGTMIGQLIFAPKFDFSERVSYAGNGWQTMGITVMGTLFQMIFVAALVLLITNLVKSSGAAIGLGVVMIVGTPILSSISMLLINMAPILKWNPFNIFIGMASYGQASPSVIKSMVHMSQDTVVIAYLVYIFAMYAIAYLIFKKRSV